MTEKIPTRGMLVVASWFIITLKNVISTRIANVTYSSIAKHEMMNNASWFVVCPVKNSVIAVINDGVLIVDG